jgi:hypothetical protein
MTPHIETKSIDQRRQAAARPPYLPLSQGKQILHSFSREIEIRKIHHIVCSGGSSWSFFPSSFLVSLLAQNPLVSISPSLPLCLSLSAYTKFRKWESPKSPFVVRAAARRRRRRRRRHLCCCWAKFKRRIGAWLIGSEW